MSNHKEHGCGCGNGGCGEHKHHHHEDHGCGCGGHHHEDADLMTLELDDGTELECQVMGVFPCEEREYIALLPLESEEVYLYRYSDEDGEVELGRIESDEEYEKVGDEFMRLVSEADEE